MLACLIVTPIAGIGAGISLISPAIMIGWIVGEVLLINRFAPSTAYWAQAEYLLVGLAMVALALRVAPGGWRGMLPRGSARPMEAMRATSHR